MNKIEVIVSIIKIKSSLLNYLFYFLSISMDGIIIPLTIEL